MDGVASLLVDGARVTLQADETVGRLAAVLAERGLVKPGDRLVHLAGGSARAELADPSVTLYAAGLFPGGTLSVVGPGVDISAAGAAPQAPKPDGAAQPSALLLRAHEGRFDGAAPLCGAEGDRHNVRGQRADREAAAARDATAARIGAAADRRDAASTGSGKRASEQVRRMMIKSHAVGRPALRREDRLHFEVHVEGREGTTPLYLYFSRMWTVGRALEDLVRQGHAPAPAPRRLAVFAATGAALPLTAYLGDAAVDCQALRVGAAGPGELGAPEPPPPPPAAAAPAPAAAVVAAPDSGHVVHVAHGKAKHALAVGPEETVACLKQRLETIVDVPAGSMKLLHKGVLKDSTLVAVAVKNSGKVTLVRCRR